MMMCGGASAPSKPSEEDKARLLPIVKNYLTEHLGHEPADLKITDISRQIVNGTNHFVRVISKSILVLHYIGRAWRKCLSCSNS